MNKDHSSMDETPASQAHEKLRWGILGAGNITQSWVGPAIKQSRNGAAVAVASRDAGRGKRIAAMVEADRVYTNYTELIDDPEVDAIYIALPNALHCEWSIAALEGGKHVLCEKPLTMSVQDARQIFRAADASGRVAVEGLMYRCQPRNQRVRELVTSGAIGPVAAISLVLSDNVALAFDSDNFRFRRELGGGALYEIGCYCIDVLRWIMAEQPEVAYSNRVISDLGVDCRWAVQLTFPSGATASVYVGSDAGPASSLVILGGSGSIAVADMFGPTANRPNPSIKIELPSGESVVEDFDWQDPYLAQIEAFGDTVLLGHQPFVSADESIGNQELLDRIQTAAN
jgi:D-xylose 1-dehydrogenase (NADP+, D-xylono-1,5-lactone-forming)